MNTAHDQEELLQRLSTDFEADEDFFVNGENGFRFNGSYKNDPYRVKVERGEEAVELLFDYNKITFCALRDNGDYAFYGKGFKIVKTGKKGAFELVPAVVSFNWKDFFFIRTEVLQILTLYKYKVHFIKEKAAKVICLIGHSSRLAMGI